MAWNPSPKVAAAREIGRRFGRDMVVVLMIHDGQLEAVSYGRTKALCAEAKGYADKAFDAITRPHLRGAAERGPDAGRGG